MKSRAVFITVASFLWMTGCTTTQHGYQEPWPNVKVGDVAPNSQLAVIEFDEQGDFWNKPQLAGSLAMIRATPKPLLITYEHGWRHNAEPDDQDLVHFKAFIDALNKTKPGGYTACGIYIGWRGAAVEEPKGSAVFTTVPALLSFWNRKWATDRMADIGLSQALSQTSAASWKNGGRVVVMGHSFGGRIMEKTVGLGLASQAEAGDSMRPVADLAILINPASESLTARKLKLALGNWDKPYPLIVAIGAKDDSATGKAWNWGYDLAPQPATRDYLLSTGVKDSQREYLNKTVTNDPKQQTHELVAKTDSVPAPASKSGSSGFAENLAGLSAPGKATRNDPILIRSGPGGDFKPYILEDIDPNTVPGVPMVLDSKAYWVMRVPKEVLSGHSGNTSIGGIFSPAMTDLYAGLFARVELARRPSGAPRIAPSTQTSAKAKSPSGVSDLAVPPITPPSESSSPSY